MCKVDSIAYTGLVEKGRIFKFLHGLNSKYDLIRVQILGKEKMLQHRICHYDRKRFHKRSTSEGKPFTKSSHGEYYTYCKRPGHTKDTYYKLYGKEKILEHVGGNKGSTLMWVTQTTFDKENNIQAFSKEEMNCLQALLNLISKSLGSCGLTMKGKSSFNISGSVSQSIWIFDSRTTDHMTSFLLNFKSHLKLSKEQLIIIANGDHVPIVGFGKFSLSLHNVLHVPKLANNLISIHRLIQDWNCFVTFFRSYCVIQELTWGGQLELLTSMVGYLRLFPHLFTKESFESFKCDVCQFLVQHFLLSCLLTLFILICGGQLVTLYRGLSGLYHLLMIGIAKEQGGLLKTIFTFIYKRLKVLPFDLIHSDLWGPTSNSILWAKWFVSFIDDCIRMTWIFVRNINMRLWLDNGTEFINLEFSNFHKDNGVVHELTYMNTCQQNGIAKRKNHHLLEVARALLFQMFVPNVYWGRSCPNCHLSHQ
ncbi:hypothetical protein CR513_55679, partial [Mucuna pruriens]